MTKIGESVGMVSSLGNSGPNGPRVLAFANTWVDFNWESLPAMWTSCIRNVAHAFKNDGLFSILCMSSGNHETHDVSITSLQPYRDTALPIPYWTTSNRHK